MKKLNKLDLYEFLNKDTRCSHVVCHHGMHLFIPSNISYSFDNHIWSNEVIILNQDYKLLEIVILK
jgi:hypothetical protein